ncbi:MAG: DUF4443 domain-containing protein [Candidatus Korarchaeum sp.]|nr:DUF4443 domain-containing protein [Candidatus Korarchaeum sp.]MDW8035969.1 DUF4443 domain-containing protein [Candidatus Korarchaeum sp.]
MVISELRAAVERLPGPLPTYNLLHAVLLLLTLEEGSLGRKKISSLMELGEGSVRSLISKLRDIGWVNCNKEGCFLTELGKARVRKLRECLVGPIEVELSEIVRGVVYATLVKCVNYSEVLELRDEAVRSGGRGAVVLRKVGGVLTFPETGEPLSSYAPKDDELLENTLKSSEGDLIILGISDDPRVSKLSSLAPSLLAIQGPLHTKRL